MSRRYIRLDDWEGVLRRFSELTDRPYDYYRATANNYLPRVATEIAKRLHEIWWEDAAFAESRKQFSRQAVTIESALKIEVSRYMDSMTENVTDNESLLHEIDLLSNAVVDGIITTNWDRFLETLFPDFDVYVGQDELLFSTPQSIGEIYKVHGCCSQPNSLIITADDYRTFEERNPYLAAKLLTIFVEHPILFLGYSLNDTNTMTILRSIAACLTSDNVGQLRDRLIFVQWDPEVAGYEMQSSSVVTEGFNIPVVSIRTASFTPIFEALTELPQRFPAQLLRRLKEQVYELVRTNDPNGNLYVQDIDEDNGASRLDVVFGVGAISKMGYRALTRHDLIRDVLFDNERYDANRVVDEVLPVQLARTPYVPIFKYLHAANMIDKSGSLCATALNTRVEKAAQPDPEKFFPTVPNRDKLRRQVEDNQMSLTDIIDNNSAQEAMNLVPFLRWDDIPLEELREYLSSYVHFIGAKTTVTLYFYKVVCLYDYLKYRSK